MEIITGCVLWFVAIVGLAMFGRFLKECDQSLFEQNNATPKVK